MDTHFQSSHLVALLLSINEVKWFWPENLELSWQHWPDVQLSNPPGSASAGTKLCSSADSRQSQSFCLHRWRFICLKANRIRYDQTSVAEPDPGAGGSVIKLPPGARAVTTNHRSGSRAGSGSLLFYQRLEKSNRKKSWLLKNVKIYTVILVIFFFLT